MASYPEMPHPAEVDRGCEQLVAISDPAEADCWAEARKIVCWWRGEVFDGPFIAELPPRRIALAPPYDRRPGNVTWRAKTCLVRLTGDC
jgi:hypothetical protein